MDIQGLKALLRIEDDALPSGLIATDPQAPTVPRVRRLLPERRDESASSSSVGFYHTDRSLSSVRLPRLGDG